MTPELLEKITDLVKAGATLQGTPPVASPSLIGFPGCDTKVQTLAEELWVKGSEPVRQFGKGRVICGEVEVPNQEQEEKKSPLYPSYQDTAALLAQDGQPKIFCSNANLRFHQRRTADRDIFFVANRGTATSSCTGIFRTDGSKPELWDPTTGNIRALPSFSKQNDGTVSVPLEFAAREGYFVVFDRKETAEKGAGANFASLKPVQSIDGTWQVRFDPTWGDPDQPVPFATLMDWTTHEQSGIKYYSGIAVYEMRFDGNPVTLNAGTFLDLGKVEDMARVTLNGKTLGTVWSAPYSVSIPAGLLKKTDDLLQIEVVNTWHNRLVGDQQPEDADKRKLQWESGLLGGKSYSAGRYTFSTKSDAKGALHPAGLLGPVRIMIENNE